MSLGFWEHAVQHRVSNFCVVMLLREFQMVSGSTQFNTGCRTSVWLCCSGSFKWFREAPSSTPGVELLRGYVAQGVSGGFGEHHPVKQPASKLWVVMLAGEFQVLSGHISMPKECPTLNQNSVQHRVSNFPVITLTSIREFRRWC